MCYNIIIIIDKIFNKLSLIPSHLINVVGSININAILRINLFGILLTICF